MCDESGSWLPLLVNWSGALLAPGWYVHPNAARTETSWAQEGRSSVINRVVAVSEAVT